MGEPTDEPMAGVPPAFTEQVRDALLALYDPAGLGRHALLALAGPALPAGAARGQWLRQALLDAIEALRPAPGVAAMSRPWRSYRILELRYIEGYDVVGAVEQMALSRSQYHREHHRALAAVAALLWERWRPAERWATTVVGAEPAGAVLSPRHEAAELLPAGHRQPIDALVVLEGVRLVLQPLCRRHGVELRCRLPAQAPPLHGERVALRQALLAILTHAVGAATDSLLEVALDADEREIAIRLTGTGALAPIRDGVAESRPFAEALQGRLEYDPPPGPTGRWTAALRFPASQRPALLVVDNQADFIRLVDRYLDDHPWEVVAAGDVEQAVAEARQRRPRAILLDIVIPGRDGWELLLDLKASSTTSAIPVIVCSVLDEPEMALALGAAAYLHKPISRQQLVDALAALS